MNQELLERYMNQAKELDPSLDMDRIKLERIIEHFEQEAQIAREDLHHPQFPELASTEQNYSRLEELDNAIVQLKYKLNQTNQHKEQNIKLKWNGSGAELAWLFYTLKNKNIARRKNSIAGKYIDGTLEEIGEFICSNFTGTELTKGTIMKYLRDQKLRKKIEL